MKYLINFVLLLFPSFAYSNVIASCGSSVGYGYYVDNGLIPSEKAGYSEDKISNGVIQLTSNDDQTMDVVHIDATGQKLSITADGAKLFPLTNGSNIHIIAVYPAGVVENYTFRIATNEVTWTKSSFGQLIDKTSVLRATCLFE